MLYAWKGRAYFLLCHFSSGFDEVERRALLAEFAFLLRRCGWELAVRSNEKMKGGCMEGMV
jgi:hypothetical protein